MLLKPETEGGAQVIVVWASALGHAAKAKNFLGWKKAALLEAAVLDSFARLAREADIVLVEGAGSPAEINLRAGDTLIMDSHAAA